MCCKVGNSVLRSGDAGGERFFVFDIGNSFLDRF